MIPKFTLVYWSHRQEYHEGYDTVDEAVRAAWGGLDAGVSSPSAILDARGEVVLTKDGLTWAIQQIDARYEREAREGDQQ